MGGLSLVLMVCFTSPIWPKSKSPRLNTSANWAKVCRILFAYSSDRLVALLCARSCRCSGSGTAATDSSYTYIHPHKLSIYLSGYFNN